MEDKKRIVFYSWQSDLPNKTNWGFIQEALERAIKAIHKDDEIEIKPVIDRDTQGVAGSPDISKTIFSKISQADIFVGDVSIVGSVPIGNNTFRAMPNPNVLVELGYALGVLGESRIIMVANEVFGKLESLPFDLRPRRVHGYHMPEESEPASARRILQEKLTIALTLILKELDKQLPEEIVPLLSLAEQAQEAIEKAQPNQGGLVRQYMTELANKIAEMNPKFVYNDQVHSSEQLLEAINASNGLVMEFARLAESIAMMNAVGAAKALYKGFENILNLYTYSLDSIPTMQYSFEHDLAKFLGHELFVIFFSYLLREERWEIITEILDEDLYARKADFERPSRVPFTNLSETIVLLYDRKELLGIKQISLHADLLKDRHTQGELAKLVPMEQFIEADYFLFLRAQVQPATVGEWPVWMPWSSLHMHQVPRYLQEAKRMKYAQRLFQPLGVQDIQTLRTRLAERTGSLEKGWGYRPFRFWYNVIATFDFSTIGSQ